ncbi:MAG: hypothetical protein Q9182_000864 [Xanthomendoza sp. 2 TL-2023]
MEIPNELLLEILRNLQNQRMFSQLEDAQIRIWEMFHPISGSTISSPRIRDFAPRLAKHRVFIEGYREYRYHAEEQDGIFIQECGSKRVCQGLKNLGPIDSMTVCNTWNMTYEWKRKMIYDREILPNGKACCVRWLIALERTQPDGKRLIGSPSARAWPSTALMAQTPRMANSRATQVRVNERLSSDVDFLELIKLLVSTGKQPKTFRVVDYGGWRAGIPPSLLDSSARQGEITLSDIASSLKVLQLELAEGFDLQQAGSTLDVLKQLLCTARLLEVLSLTMPGDWNSYAVHVPYQFRDIFPSSPTWLPVELRSVHVDGVSITASEFFHSFLVCLPSLVDLHLGFILLEQGQWDEIIEGLPQCTRLRAFGFDKHSLCFPGGRYYGSARETVASNQDHFDFIKANAHYVVYGGSHPGRRDEESKRRYDARFEHLRSIMEKSFVEKSRQVRGPLYKRLGPSTEFPSFVSRWDHGATPEEYLQKIWNS